MFYKYMKKQNLKRDPQKQRIGGFCAINTSRCQKTF